jgi:hypothetical protein
MRSPLAVTMIGALSLCGHGCGGDPAGDGSQGSDSGGETTQTAPSTTAQTPTTGGATEGATGSATDSVGTTTTSAGTSTSSSGGSSDSGDSSSSTGETGETATTGEPMECRPLADATTKPLVDPLSETSPTLFVRPDGYHLIHVVQVPEFETRIVKLDLAGEVVGAPSLVATPDTWRHMATNGARYAAVTRANKKSTLVVADIEPDDTLTPVGSVMIPAEGWGTGTVAVAWNPVDGEWGVLFEDQYNIDPNMPGLIHTRLCFGRVTADGTWVADSKKLLTSTDTDHSAELGDWVNPMIWAGDRYAAVWAEYGPVTTDVFLGELTADGTTTRVQIDEGRFSRGVVAWDGVGYGLAWGHWDFDDHFNLRFAYVEGGVASEQLHLGDDQIYSGDASIVANGDGFTVAWHDMVNDTTRVYYAKVDPQTLAAETVQVTEQGFDGHDWIWSMVHNGCRHAIGHMHNINPSDCWVSLFE